MDDIFSTAKKEPISTEDPLSEILGKPPVSASNAKSDPLNDILQFASPTNQSDQFNMMLSTQQESSA